MRKMGEKMEDIELFRHTMAKLEEVKDKTEQLTKYMEKIAWYMLAFLGVMILMLVWVIIR